jgi:hypothetical protein
MMSAEKPQRRSRSNATIVPDIRSLRLAVGLSIDDAAALLVEPASLLVDQESAGLAADGHFVETCLEHYLGYAARLTAAGQLPAMQSEDGGAPLIYRFRAGLGLSPRVAAEVLGMAWAELERLEGSLGSTRVEREAAWRGYADWGLRRWNRSARRAAAPSAPTVVMARKAFAELDAARELAAVQRVAYARRPSAAEAEEFVLRYLEAE